LLSHLRGEEKDNHKQIVVATTAAAATTTTTKTSPITTTNATTAVTTTSTTAAAEIWTHTLVLVPSVHRDGIQICSREWHAKRATWGGSRRLQAE